MKNHPNKKTNIGKIEFKNNFIHFITFYTLAVGIVLSIVFVFNVENLLLFGLILLLTFVPILRYAQNRDPFDALQVVSLGFIFYFLGGSLFFKIIGSNWIDFELTLVYLAVILGFFAFCIAYYSGVGASMERLFPRLQKNVNRRRMLNYASILLIASLLAGLFLGWKEMDLSPSVAGLIRNTGHFSKVATLLFLANYILKPTRKSFLIFLVALSIGLWFEFFVFGAERRTILRWIIMLIIYWHYCRHRIKIRSIIFLVALGLVMIFSLKIVSNLYYYPKNEWSFNLFMERKDQYLNRFDSPTIGIAKSLEFPIAFENFALAIEAINSGKLDLFWGASYFRFLFAVIPREIWPNKPSHLGRQIPILLRSGEGARAQPVTLLGEMYLNFGYLGIIVNMALIGILCKFFYVLLTRSKQKNSSPSVPATLVYVVTIGFVLQSFRGGFYLIALDYLFFNMLPLLVGIKYFSRHSRPANLCNREKPV